MRVQESRSSGPVHPLLPLHPRAVILQPDVNNVCSDPCNMKSHRSDAAWLLSASLTEKNTAERLMFSFPLTGIAVDKNGLIYFVDGTVIRRVDQSGVITTILGSNDLASARPLGCDAVMDIQQVGTENCT